LPAAAVASALGLPGPSTATIETLTRESLFRQFLQRTGLQHQRYGVFRSDRIDEAAAFVVDFGVTAVIKPVDSSGSKGVSVVRESAEIEAALAYAFSESRSGEIIIEEHVVRSGEQACGDGYMQDSKLAFIELGDGIFTTACWPSSPRRSRAVRIEPAFGRHVVEQNLYLESGTRVPPFRTARAVIGNLILSFAAQDEMRDRIDHFDAYCWPELE
jgi:hypothetical protein